MRIKYLQFIVFALKSFIVKFVNWILNDQYAKLLEKRTWKSDFTFVFSRIALTTWWMHRNESKSLKFGSGDSGRKHFLIQHSTAFHSISIFPLDDFSLNYLTEDFRQTVKEIGIDSNRDENTFKAHNVWIDFARLVQTNEIKSNFSKIVFRINLIVILFVASGNRFVMTSAVETFHAKTRGLFPADCEYCFANISELKSLFNSLCCSATRQTNIIKFYLSRCRFQISSSTYATPSKSSSQIVACAER